MDCTPEYKAKMIEEGRCQNPETLFVTQVDRFGERSQVGINMLSTLYPRAAQGQKIFYLSKEDGVDHQQQSEGKVSGERASQQDQGALARLGA
jgi:hypothetical protein